MNYNFPNEIILLGLVRNIEVEGSFSLMVEKCSEYIKEFQIQFYYSGIRAGT